MLWRALGIAGGGSGQPLIKKMTPEECRPASTERTPILATDTDARQSPVHPLSIRRHIPGRLFNISYMWSSADTSLPKPRPSLAMLNSRKRMGVRQSKTSVEFQLSIPSPVRRR
jgi:hypothetical protein